MEDKQIIELYFQRSESAISETKSKYGRYCHYIAYNILKSNSDAEECENDTYLKAWHTIPPKRPERLSVYLGKITRNLSLDRYEKNTALKRGGSELTASLDELENTVSGSTEPLDSFVLRDCLNRFLVSLSKEKRKIFIQRYWYFSPIKDIANENNISQSKVKMTLLRLRNELREFLEKEGINV